MGRPKKPLINRRRTLEAALRIIDEEGLDAVSIRRLGDELKVHGISLYHHFEDKNAILVGAAHLALDGIRTPRASNQDWREWLIGNATKYWTTLRKHPNLIPILTRRHPLRIGLAEHNETAGLLAIQGVPPRVIMPLLESLEAVALGFATYQAAVETDRQDDWKLQHPFLFSVSENRAFKTSRSFEIVARATVEAVLKEFEATESQGVAAPASRPAATQEPAATPAGKRRPRTRA
jgi:AcrR family transcriptional regulator